MNKLEECARAAHEEYLFQIRDRATKKDGWENVARAVIRCLMEPSETMVAAGGAEIYGHPREKAVEWAKEEKFDSCAHEATDTFRAMLQYVLDEAGEK